MLQRKWRAHQSAKLRQQVSLLLNVRFSAESHLCCLQVRSVSSKRQSLADLVTFLMAKEDALRMPQTSMDEEAVKEFSESTPSLVSFGKASSSLKLSSLSSMRKFLSTREVLR